MVTEKADLVLVLNDALGKSRNSILTLLVIPPFGRSGAKFPHQFAIRSAWIDIHGPVPDYRSQIAALSCVQ